MNSFISPLEILHVNSKKIACDGTKEGSSASVGHPLVYLNMGKNDHVTCPYCSKYFVMQKLVQNSVQKAALNISKKFSNKNTKNND